jgi:DNA-binding CsgD family transcriptional regulator
LSLYRQVLDTLSVAVFIVGPGHRIVFTNALGDGLLSDGQTVFSIGSTLKAHRVQNDRVCALETAIGHALAGEPAGHGVPLVSMAGDMIAAYVLPLAGRSGHCAVFVTQTGASNAMAVDVLRGMFNLTVAEARVALLIASGKGPQRIAIAQGVAMNTVRTHLKHIFSKMDVQDQTALAGLVTSLLPPVT